MKPQTRAAKNELRRNNFFWLKYSTNLPVKMPDTPLRSVSPPTHIGDIVSLITALSVRKDVR
ncbi:hypothetical protein PLETTINGATMO_08720 [Pseudothermotoga lettingae TMO]|nr:hypothetical protein PLETTINGATMO_08720 [Pseudothermotoga lettingae TMO]